MQATDDQIKRVNLIIDACEDLDAAAVQAVLNENAALRAENENLKDAISRLKGNS